MCKVNSVGPAFSQLLKQDLILGEGQVSSIILDHPLYNYTCTVHVLIHMYIVLHYAFAFHMYCFIGY